MINFQPGCLEYTFVFLACDRQLHVYSNLDYFLQLFARAFRKAQGIEIPEERNSILAGGGLSWELKKAPNKLMPFFILEKYDLYFVLSAQSHQYCAMRSSLSKIGVKSFMVVKALPEFPS